VGFPGERWEVTAVQCGDPAVRRVAFGIGGAVGGFWILNFEMVGAGCLPFRGQRFFSRGRRKEIGFFVFFCGLLKSLANIYFLEKVYLSPQLRGVVYFTPEL
jgi:hypothetical protein